MALSSRTRKLLFIYSLAKELQSFGMHLPYIIQINEFREFLIDNTISHLEIEEKRQSTHLARGKRLLNVRYFAPIISPTQWAKQPWSHYQVRLEKSGIDDLGTQN